MPAIIEKTIGTATRDFSTLQDWEDDQDGDLVALDEIHRGVPFNDSKFTAKIRFQGSTMDATRYMHLRPLVAEAHDGNEATGVEIELSGTCLDLSTNQDFVTIERMECHNTTTNIDTINGDLGFANVTGTSFAQMLVHGGGKAYTMPAAGQVVTLFNWFAWDFADRAIVAADSVEVFNVSLSSTSGGGFRNIDNGIVKNTISVNADGQDIQNEQAASDFDCSEDASASGANSLINKDPVTDIKFVAQGPTNADLHIQSGSVVIDDGVDLSGSINARITDNNIDIDGITRPSGAEWDMGGHEFVAAVAGVFQNTDEALTGGLIPMSGGMQ